MNNTASIVEDAQGNRQLQLAIDTKAKDSERMWVLMTSALSHLSVVEQSLAVMPDDEIAKLATELKRLEAEDAGPTEETPSILTPDFPVLKLVEPTKTMPDTETGFQPE